MKIYTRTGDDGRTSLIGGRRVAKNDPRIEAYGTLDELNSFVGAARATWIDSPIDGELLQIQHDLFEIGAQLASLENEKGFDGVAPERVGAIESAIDAMDRELPPLTSFVLPGGTSASAALQVARTVCRRAERLVIGLAGQFHTGTTVTYLNRLSDYFFVAARYANLKLGARDIPWTRDPG